MKKANTEEFIEVQTKDKTTRHFPTSFAQYSTLLANHLNSGKGGFCEAPEVEDKVMDKISEYLSHISESGPIEIERPLISDDMKQALKNDEWHSNFIDIALDDLVNLTKAASSMGIKSLIDLCCAKLASMCMDKTEDEIFTVFNINETLTEEEKVRLREENKWIEENLE